MKEIRILILVLLLPSTASSQNYQIDWHVIAWGGGHSESGIYIIDGAIDQPVIGETSSDNYIVEAGFWVGVGIPGSCVYIVGDCNHNGIALEIADVIAMIDYYSGQQTPPYTCPCPPHGATFTPDADPNSSCNAYQLADVVAEIAFYRGQRTPGAGCPDCPGSRLGAPGERTLVVPSLKSKVEINKGNMEE